jgi:nitrogen fixation/metabolism regulation signal transduction histidine kinase
MVFRRFTFEIIIRLAVLVLTMAAFVYVVTEKSFYMSATLLAFFSIGQVYMLFRQVDRTNAELTRFLNAIRFGDFLQSFSIEHLGSSFGDLNEAFDDIMERFRKARSEKESQARYLSALVDHVPVALLVVHSDGKVDLLNNAARRLMNTPSLPPISKLHQYGPVFQRDIAQTKAGEKKLTRLVEDELERHLIMSTTQITVGADAQRIVSLQDIQSELDATELTAWQDLVRVLSHEIMNSVTPIASLARTASDLVEDISDDAAAGKAKPVDLTDVKDSVRTVARRSEGLMHFVQSYKQLTQMPPPKLAKTNLNDYLARLKILMRAEWKGKGVAFHLQVDGDNLVLMADTELLDQLLINLLRNAAYAVEDSEVKQISLRSRMNQRGRITIDVEDSGPGIKPEHAEKIFLPFFTTKPDGSGVGLSLARQIMLVHRGNISAGPGELGGARFRLTF